MTRAGGPTSGRFKSRQTRTWSPGLANRFLFAICDSADEWFSLLILAVIKGTYDEIVLAEMLRACVTAIDE